MGELLQALVPSQPSTPEMLTENKSGRPSLPLALRSFHRSSEVFSQVGSVLIWLWRHADSSKGFIAIGWQSWLTLLNQRAAAQEKAEHAKHQEHFNIPQPAPREYA